MDNVARYTPAPSIVMKNVYLIFVGCGSSIRTNAIVADAMMYLAIALTGKLIVKHLRERKNFTSDEAILEAVIIMLMYMAAFSAVSDCNKAMYVAGIVKADIIYGSENNVKILVFIKYLIGILALSSNFSAHKIIYLNTSDMLWNSIPIERIIRTICASL